MSGDFWAEDPGCYLMDAEIGLASEKRTAARGGRREGRMMRTLCCGVALLLVLVLGAVGYKLIVLGDARPMPDGRSAILLTPSERDLVLAEMRAFLQAVQGIAQAVAAGDPLGAAASRPSGGGGRGRRGARLAHGQAPPGLQAAWDGDPRRIRSAGTRRRITRRPGAHPGTACRPPGQLCRLPRRLPHRSPALTAPCHRAR